MGKDITIYKTFPKNSFVDVTAFDAEDVLIAYLEAMTYEDWYLRMVKCIKKCNDSINKINYSKFDETVDRLLDRIKCVSLNSIKGTNRVYVKLVYSLFFIKIQNKKNYFILWQD